MLQGNLDHALSDALQSSTHLLPLNLALVADTGNGPWGFRLKKASCIRKLPFSAVSAHQSQDHAGLAADRQSKPKPKPTAPLTF